MMPRPSAKMHYEQAVLNEQAALAVKENQPDWAVTICFYAALHWIEGYAINEGVDINQQYKRRGGSPHNWRKNYVKDIAYNLRKDTFRRAYERLDDESRKARYLKDINSNSRLYYSCIGVDDLFKDLETIKKLTK
jgi:hypothetical protein